MKKIISIILFFLSAYSYAQKGKTIAKETVAPITTAPKSTIIYRDKPSSNVVSGAIILTVDATLAPCISDANKQCMQVFRKGANTSETLEDIEGFNFEIGYTYTIQVKEVLRTPPIGANESMYRYKWIKTLSKKEESVAETQSEKITNSSTNSKEKTTVYTNGNGNKIGKTDFKVESNLDKKWYLRKFKDVDGTTLVTEDNIIFMTINTFNDRLDGFGACNKFAAVVRSDLSTTFNISKLTYDYSNCNYKKTENLFFELLQSANIFQIRNGNLFLYNQNTFLLAFTSNPNNNEDLITTYSPQKDDKNDDKLYPVSEKQNTTYKEPITPIPTIQSSSTKTKTNKKTNTVLDETNQPITTTNTNVNSSEEDELQKQIDALEKKKAEKLAAQQKVADEAKKVEKARITKEEQEKLAEQQRIKEEEDRKAKEDKKAKKEQEKLAEQQRIKDEAAKKAEEVRIAKEEQEKLAEQQRIKAEEEKKAAAKKAKLEELAKLQEELDALDNGNTTEQKTTQLTTSKQNTDSKPTSTPKQNTVSKETNKKETTKESSSSKKTENITIVPIEKPKVIINNYSEIENNNFVYYLNDKKYKPLDNTVATFNSSSYLLGTQESTLQFKEDKLPKMMIKLSPEIDKTDLLYLVNCEFKKNKRQVNFKPLKNKISINLQNIETDFYEIVMPNKLDIGEYAFITKDDIKSNTSVILACFGIGEAEKQKKESESITVNNKTSNKSPSKNNISNNITSNSITPNNNTNSTNTLTQVATTDRVENSTEAQKPTELKYRRSSLYTLMVDDPSREYSETIKSSFINAPFPDKFNNHNLNVREINGNANSKDQKYVIDDFLNTNDIAKGIVAKWFNRSEKGTFNMDLIAERGQYDATEMDVKNAKNTVRGLSLLADAGEELIKNTFVVITDFKYTNKEDVAQITKKAVNAFASVLGRFIPGAGSAISLAQTTVNTTLTVTGKGYYIKATSYLYRLHWDEEVASQFYNNYWIDENSFDKNKKNGFERSNIFSLDYIGSEVAKEQTQSSVFTTNSEEELIAKATVKSVDQVIAKLQRNHDEFKTKTPIYNLDPIAAKIGLKEGLEGGDKYEVLEQYIDKDGKTNYKRVSVVTVNKKNIWDNRYMSSEQSNSDNSNFTTFSGRNKGLYIGMLIKQIK